MKAVRAMSVTYQPYAECVADDCDWNAPCSPSARDWAKNHVATKGHEVRVIKETVDLYTPSNT